MLDYDLEAGTYDQSRGGRARAIAAAEAISGLAPGGGTCLDVAGGTGIVSLEIARFGYEVVVLDRSAAMLELAAGRLPGSTVRGDAAALPVARGSVDLVVTLWLLHLLTPETAGRVVAQVAAVLRSGGRWVTSVDKAASHGLDSQAAPDHVHRLRAQALAEGLTAAGQASFESHTLYGTGSTSSNAAFGLAAFRRADD